MKRTFGALLLLLALPLAAHAAPSTSPATKMPAQAPMPDIRSPAFERCNSDGFQAFAIANQFHIEGANKETFEEYLRGQFQGEEYATESRWAQKLYSGELKEPWRYAAARLKQCFDKAEVALVQELAVVEECYLATEFPYWVGLLKGIKTPKDKVVEKFRSFGYGPVVDRIKASNPSLLSLVPDRIYAATSLDEQREESQAFFWGCMRSSTRPPF